MKIKTIYDVVPYLDMFYFMANNDLKSQPPYKDKHGSEYKVYSAVVDELLSPNGSHTEKQHQQNNSQYSLHSVPSLITYGYIFRMSLH